MEGDRQKLREIAMLPERSPYPYFKMGAWILGANGKYYSGCNVEKAVNSVCAEATAIVKMTEDGCHEIK